MAMSLLYTGTGCPQRATTETFQEIPQGKNLEIGKIGKMALGNQIRAPNGIRMGPYKKYAAFPPGSAQTLSTTTPVRPNPNSPKTKN